MKILNRRSRKRKVPLMEESEGTWSSAMRTKLSNKNVKSDNWQQHQTEFELLQSFKKIQFVFQKCNSSNSVTNKLGWI